MDLDEEENLVETGRKMRFYLKTDGHEETPLVQFFWSNDPKDATKFYCKKEAQEFIDNKQNQLLNIGCEAIEYYL